MALSLRSLILFALVFILLGRAPHLAAQQPAAANESPSFTVYAPDQSPVWDQLYFLPANADPVKLVFLGSRRSAPLKTSGTPAALVFGIERIDPVTQKKIYVPVAETAWPESAKKTLVVFIRSGGTAPRTQALALDDGLAAFPLRTVRLVNATDTTFFAKVADFQGAVPPGISPCWPYAVKSEDPTQVGTFPLALALNARLQDGSLMYNSHAEAWPLGRSLVFIIHTGANNSELQVRALVDSPSPPKR